MSWKITVRRLATGLAIILGMVQAGEARAACMQADIAGLWQHYSLEFPRNGAPYWNRCTLSIKPNGVIDKLRSVCTSQAGVNTPVFGLVQVIGKNGCTFQGHYYLGNRRISLVRAAMNRSKDHLDGVANHAQGMLVFNATRL